MATTLCDRLQHDIIPWSDCTWVHHYWLNNDLESTRRNECMVHSQTRSPSHGHLFPIFKRGCRVHSPLIANVAPMIIMTSSYSVLVAVRFDIIVQLPIIVSPFLHRVFPWSTNALLESDTPWKVPSSLAMINHSVQGQFDGQKVNTGSSRPQRCLSRRRKFISLCEHWEKWATEYW